jgi:GNAT superfamily N-acetyltransferase
MHRQEVSDSENGTIQYLRAASEDIPGLIKCRVDFLTELLGPQPDADVRHLEVQLEAYLRKALSSGTYISCIAKAGEEIVGTGGLVIRQYPGGFDNPSGLNGYIMNMYTVREYRRRGISSAILQLLMAEGRAQGITKFELNATAQGEPVYRQAGFILHPEPTYRRFDPIHSTGA